MAIWLSPNFYLQALTFGHNVWDPGCRFESSWLLPSWTLFAVRAAIALYCFTVRFFIIGWEVGNHDGLDIHDVHKSFSYFTVLGYWGLSFYFFISAIHTFSYALNDSPLLNRFPRPLQALHYLLYSTITTFPFLVTIVYWSILAPSSFATPFALWSNVSQHGLNSLFALFELLLTRVNPAPWIHLFWLIVLLLLYLGVAFITHATKGYYVYSFLNPAPKLQVTYADGVTINEGGVGHLVSLFVVGILVAIVLIFLLSRGLATARKWLTEKKCEVDGQFGARRKMSIAEVELETQPVGWR